MLQNPKQAAFLLLSCYPPSLQSIFSKIEDNGRRAPILFFYLMGFGDNCFFASAAGLGRWLVEAQNTSFKREK
jgi:hypothetical protein